MTSTPAETTRRTQAERRAATRAALLEAAIECLAEEGYSSLTTRRVSERAGVSQGIQMHYFPTKTHLLTEAVRYVAANLASEILSNEELRSLGDADRREAALDEVWRIHRGPLFQAGMELWMAARTEPELRETLRALEHDLTQLLHSAAREVFPAETGKPSFAELLDAGMATVRGLAMLVPVSDPKVIEQRWQATKRLLLLEASRWLDA
jgi:AcrR family transcriptional regulator